LLIIQAPAAVGMGLDYPRYANACRGIPSRAFYARVTHAHPANAGGIAP
jgi:hypothetical protein